ncbi:FAD-dependent monooxygenase [Paractinoplanes globisporus]|uniref:FAD-dependent monooxygenase n=1 Tax=Paractinoplanes globisporus TaxID=113565 RepID=A0ABW6WER6_9ACTN|nr:FAD-dependent monooxygenase [Actinoplanes globisporus]
MTKTAAIIGGGIGGLAAAIALRQAGWQVTVHERQTTTPAVGTALGIWPAALRALDELGLGDEVRKRGVPQSDGELRRPDGTRIAAMDVDRLERRLGDRIHLISRPALLTVLRDAAADGCDLRLGEPVGAVEPLRREFGLVVAADGVFSRTREELFGDRSRARYAGSTAWRGTLDEFATDTFAEIWGAGVKFGVTPQEGGRTNWFASAALPEGRFHPGAERDALLEIFGGWSDPAVARVLGTVREEGILRHDIYVTPRLPSYVSGNVVLIGDAAHAMAPDLGRGACEAIIDAVTLGRAGPAAYERDRRRSTQRLVRMAGAASRLTRMRHGVPLRNGLLKMALR